MGLEELLEFGAMFDWLTPALSAGRGVAGMGKRHMFFSVNSGDAGAAANLLASHGIKCKEPQANDGEYGFTVDGKQAQYAQYLLRKAGYITKK